MKSLLSFRIDPALNRLWKTMGYDDDERKGEVQKLEEALVQAYQVFIYQTSSECEKFRQDLHSSLIEYERLSTVFGDDSFAPKINHSQSLRDQKEVVDASITELHKFYTDRMTQFTELHSALFKIFEKLQVPVEARGEFAEVGDTDLTEGRLQRFSVRLKVLQNEVKQREEIVAGLQSEIESYLEELGRPEEISEYVSGTIGNEAISRMKDAIESLEKEVEERKDLLRELFEDISNLNEILLVPEEERIQKEDNLSNEYIETVSAERDRLEEEKVRRIPEVVRNLRAQLAKVYKEFHVPRKVQKNFIGGDMEEEANFLMEELKRVQEQFINAQPIVKTIFELEEAREIVDEPDVDINTSDRGNIKKMMAQEAERREAREKIPRLEKELLELLLRFKEENGYNFTYNGEDYIDSLQYVQPERQTLGKSLLKMKLNEYGAKPSAASKKRHSITLRARPRFG